MLNSTFHYEDGSRLWFETAITSHDVAVGNNLVWLRAVVWPVLFAIVAQFLWVQYNLKGVANDCHLPPGSFGIPLLGETIQFVANGRLFSRSRLSRNDTSIFRTNILLQPCVVVTGADNVRQILYGEGRTVEHVGPPTARLLFGPGALSNSGGETLRRHKRIVAKAFTFNEMTNYVGHIHRTIRHHLRSWCKEGKISGVKECRFLAFTVTAHVLLGMKIDNEQVTEISDLFETFMTSFFSFPLPLPGTAFSKGLEARKNILVILRRYVNEAQENSLLRKLSDEIGDIDVTCDICLELLFGSYLTVASASCSTLLLLANHDHVMTELGHEMHHVVSEKIANNNRHHEEDKSLLAWDDLSRLRYTGDVVKEVLRVMPPIAGGFRKTLQPIKLGGYEIPENWLIQYSIADTHETSTIFSDPLAFQPSRWSSYRWASQQNATTDTIDGGQSSATNDRQMADDSYLMSLDTTTVARQGHYLPFGAGSRKCIGQEFAKMVLKIFIAELVSCHEWQLVDPNPSITTSPVPFPSDGLPLVMIHKSTSSCSRAV